jgi:hypothetical protein
MKTTLGFFKVFKSTVFLCAALALGGCDLLNQPETDIGDKIDEAAKYANAARLTVQVRLPNNQWGSVQEGTLPSEGTRKGFAFTVEFIPNSSAYRLDTWRACRVADYDGEQTQGFLSAPDVIITKGAGGQSTVTINTTEQVILFPWCVDAAIEPPPPGAISITNAGMDADGSDGEIGLAGLAAFVNSGGVTAGKTYVLAGNIILSGGWTPIGTSAAPFSGTLYGDGHTITIRGMNGAAEMGLFGAVSGAVIRDLTVVYDTSGGITVNSAAYFGGIAGVVTGTTQILNTVMGGTMTLTVSGDNNIWAGGFAGQLNGASSIHNV